MALAALAARTAITVLVAAARFLALFFLDLFLVVDEIILDVFGDRLEAGHELVART